MLVSSGCTPGGGGGATIIWNLATGKRVATFKHPEEMFACDISPDARLIAVGCEFGAVRVYEAAAEPHIAVLRPANGRGSIVALSPDGKTVALAEIPDGKTGNDVLLIDLKSGSTIGKFHEEGSFVGLAFAPDGSSLFGCEERGRTIQWELPSGTTRRKFAFADPAGRRAQPGRAGEYTLDGFNQMRLSPDGSLLARARDDGLIGLWDVPSGRWVDWLDSGSTDTAVIDFSPDGRTLVARHPESCVLWDVRTRQPQRTIATARGYPTVRFCSKGSVIAYGVRGRIQFFDAGTGRILSENKDPRSAGMGIVFHPGGSVCFASAFDSSIRLWDPRTGRELLSLQKHTTLIHSLLLTPDGNTLISADSSGTVLVWDLRYYNEHIRRELQYRVSTER
jgi:WD40 repeat protein